jgi:hypothetical protein
MMGSFLRKFLFYHVEIAYLVLLCQTTAIVSDYYAESSSYLVSFGLIIWGLLLLVHFILFHAGAYFALQFYDQLTPQLTVDTSYIDKRLSIDDIGFAFFVINGVCFVLLYSFSTVDIMLFAIWSLLYFHAQHTLEILSRFTSQNTHYLFEGVCFLIGPVSLAHFVFLHPLLVVTIICLTLVGLRLFYSRHLQLALPVIPWSEWQKTILIMFAVCFVGQFVFWSTKAGTITTSILLSFIPPFVLPQIGVYWDNRVDDYLKLRFEELSGRSINHWREQFLNPNVKLRYFQFFFVYYSARLIAILLDRYYRNASLDLTLSSPI